MATPPTKVKSFSKIIITLILVYLLTQAIFFSLRLALHADYPLAVVEGTSMVPTYLDGDLLILQGVSSEKIQIGTVIVFHSPNNWGQFIIHRVTNEQTSESHLYFITKGDNNCCDDPWRVPAENIIGVVVPNIRIPVIGKLVLTLQSPIGLLISGTLIIVIIVLEVFKENKSKNIK